MYHKQREMSIKSHIHLVEDIKYDKVKGYQFGRTLKNCQCFVPFLEIEHGKLSKIPKIGDKVEIIKEGTKVLDVYLNGEMIYTI